MHKKRQGSIGEIAVTLDLLRRNYAVFTEQGDLSKVDLIALVQDVPIKIQVKCLSLSNGKIELSSGKTGPGYQFVYTENQIDIFAIYVLEKDTVLYVSASELIDSSTTKRTISIRFEPTQNNQTSGIHWWTDYLSFEKALRGHTPHTLPEKLISGGEEMVQTATEKSG